MRLVLLFLFFASQVNGQSRFYNLECITVEGSVISLKQYEGRRVLILTTDALRPDRDLISLIDTLIQQKRNLSVLVATVSDLGGKNTVRDAENLKLDLKGDLKVLAPLNVSKQSGSKQSPLFQWLTKESENGHFGYDVWKPGQLFLISESGELLAVLSEGAPFSVISEVVSK